MSSQIFIFCTFFSKEFILPLLNCKSHFGRNGKQPLFQSIRMCYQCHAWYLSLQVHHTIPVHQWEEDEEGIILIISFLYLCWINGWLKGSKQGIHLVILQNHKLLLMSIHVRNTLNFEGEINPQRFLFTFFSRFVSCLLSWCNFVWVIPLLTPSNGMRPWRHFPCLLESISVVPSWQWSYEGI